MVKVLIVDDSKVSRRVLRNILEEAGHTIIYEAVNGVEAVKRYELEKPDLVTMDITMPIMDGFEALQKIILAYPDAKVIMVTAAGQKSNILEALKRGASDFIEKPFEKEDILEIINKVLG